jgi:hypothetical protein
VDAAVSVFDADGQWLTGGRTEDAFSRQTGIGQTLSVRDPALAKAMADSPIGMLQRDDGQWVFDSVRLLDTRSNATLGSQLVPLAGDVNALHWRIALHFDQDALVPRLASTWRLALL